MELTKVLKNMNREKIVNILENLLNQRSLDILIFVVLFLILFITKLDYLGLPFYWDEMGVYIEHLYKLSEDFTYIFNTGAFHGHPPGLQLLLLPIYKIFNQSVESVRVSMLFASVGTLFLTYKIGEHFHSKMLGIFASILLLVNRTFFVYSIQFVGDNFLAFITALFVYLTIKKKFVLALLVGLFMGGCRETAIAFGPLVMLFVLITDKTHWKKWMFVCLAPFVSLSLFYTYQKIFGGSFFAHQAFETKDILISLEAFKTNFKNVIFFIFIEHKKYLVILFIPAVILSLIKIKFHKKDKIDFAILAMSVFVILEFVVFFSFNSGTLDRYFLPIYPYLYLLLTIPFIFLLKELSLLMLPFIILYSFHYKQTVNHNNGMGYENTMRYVEVVGLFQQMAHYIENNHKGKVIFSPWPIFHVFQFPFMGYVKEKFQVVSLGHGHRQYKANADFDIFIWGNNTDMYVVNDKARFVKANNLKLIKKFTDKDNSVEIYSK